MAKQKKFGSFGGVFTPSILTILGVIMYLRLPWIAGQAGLFATLGIVFLAHLISVTTGLSVSSIATDKKVKAGGTYYMISRSLGLPIGGTLGLALFVGLSFSVSLYLIGFAESFLGYWNLEITKNSIRLAGSIILVSVTIITFISTSLAIKMQYIIMTAIILSLISIVLGNHDYVPVEPLLTPIAEAAPFIILFGIFFPAVTGFEAGVSMSGDLQDPKKSIPSGTITAIVIGLVVYILLAFFFAYSVSSDLLVNDPKALFKIAWIPELVVAGIWGATLSSAFGSILGAPRILQATATDNITHRFFSKGYGELNEPRNALLLTFIIAEIGILIGELDVIARIVSMFFITTYGFLNLSCAIESWASSDFRPDFKIPKIVSIIGSAACFIVMIQLDFIAMVGATIILGSLFIYLKRKELMLEGGDAWGSVWSSIVRTGLSKLSIQKTDARNWRPNILLFSGAASARPHLIEIAKAISGKLGIVSNFNLIEKPNAETLFKEETFTEAVDLKSAGIFTRSYVCRNFYQGIDVISRVYGFSGVEPNTVIMGWGRDTKDPAQFTELVGNFNELDLNSIYVDLDKERGFGNHKTIDVWWRGAGNNFSFELSIIRYLTSESDWRDSNVRFLIISQRSSIVAKAYKNLSQVLEQFRVPGKIVIINNEIERRNPIDIIKAESASADLTVFGIPDVNERTAGKYIDMINDLTFELGTTLLVHASTYFKEIDIGIVKEIPVETHEIVTTEMPVLKSAKNTSIEKEIQYLHSKTTAIYDDFFRQTVEELNTKITTIVISAKNKSETIFDYLHSRSKQLETHDRQKLIQNLKKSFINYLIDEIKIISEESDNISQLIKENIDLLHAKLDESAIAVPDKLLLHYEPEDLAINKDDDFLERFNKRILKLSYKIGKKPITQNVDLEDHARFYLNKNMASSFVPFLKRFDAGIYKLIAELHNTQNSFLFALDSISDKADKNETYLDIIRTEEEIISKQFAGHLAEFQSEIQKYWKEHLVSLGEGMQNFIFDLENINVKRIFKRKRNLTRNEKDLIEKTFNLPNALTNNIRYLLNSLKTDLITSNISRGIRERAFNFKLNFQQKFDRAYLKDLIKLEREAERLINSKDTDASKLEVEFEKGLSLKSEFAKFFEDTRNLLLEVPEYIQIVSEDFGEQFEQSYFTEGSSVEISFRKLVEFYFESEFIGNLQKRLEKYQLELDESGEVLKDIVNLTNFNLQNEESDLLTDLTPANQAVTNLESALKRFREEKEKIEKIGSEIIASITTYLVSSFEPLKSYRIIKTSHELGSHVREMESKKVVSRIFSSKENLSNWFQSLLVQVFYKRSEGILFAKRITADASGSVTIPDFYNLTESITPDEEILSKIPYYYKKLFSGRASVSKEFWIGRKKELAECGKAVKLFRSGHNGGLLIIGERNFGKSSISKHTAEVNFKQSKIFNVNPVSSGSIDVELFEKSLSASLGTSLPIEEALRSGVGESVIIIHDLELWWERSPEGWNVINRLFELISMSEKKWFFIVNMNVNSFEFIRKLKAIDQYFLAVVECEPFDAEELKDIILLRHDASGMDFKLNNIDEDDLSQLRLARFFNSLFDYSKGNIGSALNGWINCIYRIDGNMLYLKNPADYNLSLFDSLPDDWIIVLVQIILHRRLSYKRISKFFIDEPVFLNETIDKLKRARLIREFEKDVLEVNPYIEPYLLYYLNKKGLV